MRKYYIKIIFLFLINTSYNFAQIGELKLSIFPTSQYPGKDVVLKTIDNKQFSKFISVKWDNKDVPLLKKNDLDSLILTIPIDAILGTHDIVVTDFLLEKSGSINIEVIFTSNPIDSINGHDPDPKTQNGIPIDLSKNQRPVTNYKEVFNPTGGNNNTPFVPCDSLHKIDGDFTELKQYNRKEWTGITPLKGKFSYLYIDFCNVTNTMYLMNDWFWGTGKYDSSSCYNKFEIFTGGGEEHWIIKVYNNLKKGIVVLRNNVDVSKDSNFVLGGMAGFHSSLLEDSLHTIYEFGIKVKSGIFYLPAAHDPYQPPKGGMTVTTVCNEDGFGLIQEPIFYHGEFTDKGTTLRNNNRYIPINGVAGLVTEPNIITGTLNNNSCLGPHVVDGDFTKLPDNTIEWSKAKPAVGKYSKLYADYCDGFLFILNDWFLGTLEPDEGNCYNLFEVYTGNGTEHWGIYVYHNIKKGVRVFRNGVEVSLDTSVVKGGQYSFHQSLLEKDTDTANTIYEFSIKAKVGNWMLQMCDPGPSSFCDGYPESAPRMKSDEIKIKNILNNVGVTNPKFNAFYNDTLNLQFFCDFDISSIFSRKFKAIIIYDKDLFYPVISTLNKGKKLLSSDSLSYEITSPGTVVVENKSSSYLSNGASLFNLKGMVLAGYDSISYISGSIAFGNNTSYLYQYRISPVSILASSRCILTSNLVKNKEENQLMLLAVPNILKRNEPINASIFLKENSIVNIQIYNISGDIIKNYQNIKLNSGWSSLSIDDFNKIPGNYYLRISNSEITKVANIIVED